MITGALFIPEDWRVLAGMPHGARPPVMQVPLPHDQHPCLKQCWRVGSASSLSSAGVCLECGRPSTAKALVLGAEGRSLRIGCFILAQELRGFGHSAWRRIEEAVDEALVEQAPLRLQSTMTNFRGTLVLVDENGTAVPQAACTL